MSRERTRVAPFNPFLFRPLLSSSLFLLLPKHNRIEWTPEKWPRRNKCGGREGERASYIPIPCALRKRLQIIQDDTPSRRSQVPNPPLPSQSQCRKFSLPNGVSNLFRFHGSIDQKAPHLSRGWVNLPEIVTNPNRVNSKPEYNEKRSFSSTGLRRARRSTQKAGKKKRGLRQ